LRYMHRNPVKRELVQEPEQWLWSNFRHYKYGEAGLVRVNDCDLMQMSVRRQAV
jgi:putative transposase